MLLHILGHIETEHGVFIAEHSLSQRLAQLGLAYARRTEKDERTYRTLGILDADPAAADSSRHSRYSLVLAHNALMQYLLHIEQSIALFARQLDYGDLGPRRHYSCDILAADFIVAFFGALLPALLSLIELRSDILLLIAELSRALKVLLAYGGGLLALEGLKLSFKLLDLVRIG